MLGEMLLNVQVNISQIRQCATGLLGLLNNLLDLGKVSLPLGISVGVGLSYSPCFLKASRLTQRCGPFYPIPATTVTI